MRSSAALRRLLHELIDYAGLFPPAALPMNEAVRNYAAYRTSQHAWMLGRFICPVGRLEEFSAAVAGLRSPPRLAWRLSVIVGDEPAKDLELVDAFNRLHAGRCRADTLELRVEEPRCVEALVAPARERFECFAEFPLDAEPEPFVEAVATSRVMAKARMGGVHAGAIPASAQVARFMGACADAAIPFKATAGLHHPLRSMHRLTYEEDAPSAVMHGFLNVFVAAALAFSGVRGTELEAVLEESELSEFTLGETLGWRSWRWSEDEVRSSRTFARAFGSCSFTEPIHDLARLQLT